MQFLLTAYDFTDTGALSRRMSIRDKHVEHTNKIKEKGQVITGVAILDENQKMIGSMLVFDFPNREELDKHLKDEPYITGRVWEKIEIKPCKIGPSFVKK